MRAASLAVVFLGFAWPAAAAMPNAKPGLWESITTTIIEQGPPPNLPGLAKMPPEERQKLQKSLSPQSAKPTTSSMRQCVTQEMIERWDTFATGGSDANCRRTVVDQSSQRIRTTMVCGDGRSTGEAEFSAAGPDRIIGKMTMRTKTDRGETKLDLQVEARWISSDCGALKPGERTRAGGG